MDLVRDMLAALLALAAAILLALWAPAVWLQDTVVDRDGFLEVARPLGTDQGFQDAVATTAVDQLFEQVDLPRFVADRVRPVVDDQVHALARTPAFDEIWAATAEDLHATLLDPDGGTVTADLNPYVDQLMGQVEDRIGFSVPIPHTDLLRLDVATIAPSPWPERARMLADASGWIGWAGIGSGLASIAVAARRGAMLFGLGLLLALGGGALLLAAHGAWDLAPGGIVGARVIDELLSAFEEHFRADMRVPGFALVGAGAASMVIALLALALRPRGRAA